MLDTIYTLQAMQADVLVIRDAEPGVPALVARHVAPHVSMLNAGEAHLSHPTQGLLDVLTIRQRKGDLGTLCVAIVGDVRHSRVARSAAQALSTLGVGELRLVAPAPLMPDADEFPGAKRFDALAAGIAGADVVMSLRIQRERMAEAQIPDTDAYLSRVRHHARTARARAQPDAIVMHPGPMNRGVEIASDVADGPASAIQQQVTNGVAVRMAVLATIVRNVQVRNIEAGRRAG